MLLQLALVVQGEPVLVVQQSWWQERSHGNGSTEVIPWANDFGGLMVRMVVKVVLIMQVMVVVKVMMAVGCMMVGMSVRYAIVVLVVVVG